MTIRETSQNPNHQERSQAPADPTLHSAPLPKGPDEPSKVHQFSSSFARIHGIPAAIIAGYLANRIAATHKRPGEGYRCTLDALARHYPYLSRSAIAAALGRLRKARVLNCHQNNLRNYDRTCHYGFTSESALRQVSEDSIYFVVAEALEHKLPAALVLTNLRMRLTEEVRRKPDLATYRFTARNMEAHLPLKRGVLSRTLKYLEQEAGLLKTRRCAGFDRALTVVVASFHGHGTTQDSCGANPNQHDLIQAGHDTVPNAHAQLPHNNILLEEDIESGRWKSSLESFNSYEGRPAAPTAARACFDSSAARPSMNQSSCASGVTARQAAERVEAGEDAALEQKAGSVIEPTRPPSPSFLIDEQHPFAPRPPFTPPPRQPVPTSLAELRQANADFWRYGDSDRQSILRCVDRKVDAVIRQHGVGRVFRWLAVKDDDRLFESVREAVERCRCPKADSMQFNGRLGVDWFCAEWLVDACRRYLDDHAHSAGNAATNTVLNLFLECLPPYYRANQAALELEGLGHLRYGEDVRAERCQSPDAGLEQNEHLSAAEKTRVFHNALLSVNRMGRWNGRGGLVHDVVGITKGGLELVRRFFETNPHWTVAPLLEVMDLCIQRAYHTADPGGYLKDFAVSRGTNLTYFMRHFERILTESEYHSSVPAVTFPDEWARKEAA